MDETVKALKIEGVEPTPDSVRKGDYPISRPFLFLTKEEPTGLVKEFINFCLSAEGQEIVAKKFIPVK